MSTDPTQDDAKALAVQTELRVVTSAIETALGVREITVEFASRRDTLTAAAYEFTTPPETDDAQETILTAQRAVQKLRTELKKNGESLKAPLNSARETIIDIVKRETATLEKAENHLAGLVNHRQQKLAAARREAEEAAARETKRIADEAAAATRAQEAAESARKAAELAAQRAEEAKGKAKQKAAEDAARLAAEASRLEDEAMEKGMAAEAAPEPIVAPVSDLPMARTIIDFELRGRTPSEKKISLILLLNAHPEFFNVHLAETTPRGFSLTLKIQDLTDALCGKEPFKKLESVPGINITTRLSQLR